MRLPARVLCFLLLAFAARADFHFEFDPDEQTWLLTNGVGLAEFQLTRTGYFVFKRFDHLPSGTSWAAAQTFFTSPIDMRIGNVTYDAYTPFTLVRQSAYAIFRRGYRQTIVLDDRAKTVRATIDLEMFEGHAVLRWRVRLQNLLKNSVTVVSASMVPFAFRDATNTYRTLRVNQWVKAGKEGNFEPLEDQLNPNGQLLQLRSGAHAQHCAWLALRDQSDRGLFFGLEFDGRATTTLRNVSRFGYVQLSSQIDNLNNVVEPGETFAVPAAFMGAFSGDWDEAGYRTQRFAETAIAKPMPDPDFPYVIWDSWKYGTAVEDYTLRRNAEIAARIGIEAFVIDLGWARDIGDWQADPGKFPSGLRSLSDFVHSLGMKFGLHFALTQAMDSSPVLRQNPGWTATDPNNYFDSKPLCLAHRPVRDWLVAEAVRMIDEYGVDWIVQDGENMVKECTRTTHTHDPADSNYANSVLGLNAVISAIQAQRPAVIWENSEDGGNMMTFNMLRNYHTSIAADDAGPLTTRQAVFGVLYPFSPRYADRYMPDEQLDTYVTRSYMFGGPWIFMNRLPQMKEEDLQRAEAEIKVYKTIRRQIRNGQVFRLTPRPDDDHADILQSYDSAADRALVIAVRPALAANPRIRLRGLNPEGIYRVRFQEDRRVLTMSGQQLINNGLLLNTLTRDSGEIIYVDPVR